MLKTPSYSMPVSKTHHQQKGANWLTSTALVTWQNQRDRRLASWGLGAAHAGTCILVPQEWKYLQPESVVHRFQRENFPESEEICDRLVNIFSRTDLASVS